MMDGGALWFPDLTVADPTYALPVLTSLTFLATVELGAADGMQGQSADMLKNLKNFMRGLAVVMVPFTASLPAVRFCRMSHHLYSLLFFKLCELASWLRSTQWASTQPLVLMRRSRKVCPPGAGCFHLLDHVKLLLFVPDAM